MTSGPQGDGREPQRDGREPQRRHVAGDAGVVREALILHQPPNPADLDRVAPGTPECARVRGLLRDYVDGDLSSALVLQVDEHVHDCRICAVELSRAEHEVLRLRRAYLPERVCPIVPAPGFVGRVLDRLVAEAGQDADAERIGDGARAGDRREDGDRPDERPTGREANEASRREAVRRTVHGASVHGASGQVSGDGQSNRQVVRREGWSRARELDVASGSPAGLLVLGAFLLFVLGIGVRLFSSAEIALDRATSMVVTWANNAFDGDSNRLEPGDSVGDRGKLLVGVDGVARVDLRDSSLRTQPAASLELKDGEVRLEGGEPMLVQGRLGVLAKREVEIPLLDGSRITLGAGEYIIAAEVPVDMFDQGPWSRQNDPLGGMPGQQVSIEVVSGQPARITRPGGAVTLIARGDVGVYATGGGVVDVVRPGPVANVDRQPQPQPEPVEPPTPQVAGMALEASGMPTAMASVFLRSVVQGGNGWAADEIGFAATGSDGRFVIATSAAGDRDYSIVMAMPSNLRHDLAVVPPQAVPLLRQGGQAQLARPLRFDFSARWMSSVWDETGMPIAGVRVELCIVDEMFGVLWPLEQRAVTGVDGSFQVARLPARLPAHQRLLAVLAHDQYEVACVPVPERGDVAAAAFVAPLRLRALDNARFAGLPPNSVQTLWQEVEGTSGALGASIAVRRVVTTDFFGRVPPTPVGSGRIWLLDVQADELRALEADPLSPDMTRLLPTGDATPRDKHFRQLRQMDGTRLLLGSSYRHESLLLDKGEDAASAPVLHISDVQGHPVGEAQLFAVRDDGPRGNLTMRFVGFSSSLGVVSLAGVKPDENVVVLGADKAVGWLVTPMAGSGISTVTLLRTGSVVLGQSLRPAPGATDRAVTIEFERIGADLLPGLRPRAVRFACDDNQWQVGDLPPGDYRAHIDGHTYEISVPPLDWVVLQ